MSEFERAQKSAQRRRGLTTLQIAWLVVLLAMGGVVLWLALSPPLPPKPTPAAAEASQPETLEAGPETIPEPIPAAAPEETQTGMPQDDAAAAPQDSPPAATDAAPSSSDETAAVATPQPAAVALTPAPVDGLVETSELGPLPKVDGDREPWQVYARPYPQASSRPRVAILMAGLGLSKSITEAAIATLPAEISLGFSPYGDNLQARIDDARKAGHEVLLLLPMEPHDYPKNDPGPHTLLVAATPQDNMAKLHWVMSRAVGYVGLVNEMGSTYTASEPAMTLVLEEMKKRGLLFLDARTSQHSVAASLARTLRVARVVNNRYIDNDKSEDSIRKRLAEIENLARTYGAAAGIARPYPLSMRVLGEWSKGLAEHGIDLAPITAVANRQPVR